jgi:phage terminase large subunit
MDYGFTHYTVVLLGLPDGDGNMFIVDEHAERLWLPQRHAPAIQAMLRGIEHADDVVKPERRREHKRPLELPDLKRFVAGGRMCSANRATARRWRAICEARDPADACANTDRINGWAEILHRASAIRMRAFAPKLFIHERCARLLECLPSLQHDPNRPEDVLKVDADEDGVGGDDAADALRYLRIR